MQPPVRVLLSGTRTATEASLYLFLVLYFSAAVRVPLRVPLLVFSAPKCVYKYSCAWADPAYSKDWAQECFAVDVDSTVPNILFARSLARLVRLQAPLKFGASLMGPKDG